MSWSSAARLKGWGQNEDIHLCVCGWSWLSAGNTPHGLSMCPKLPLNMVTEFPGQVTQKESQTEFTAVFFFSYNKKYMYIILAAPKYYLDYCPIVACGIFPCSILDPVSWPGIEPRPPALGVQSLSHWTTKDVPEFITFYNLVLQFMQCHFCLIPLVEAVPKVHSLPNAGMSTSYYEKNMWDGARIGVASLENTVCHNSLSLGSQAQVWEQLLGTWWGGSLAVFPIRRPCSWGSCCSSFLHPKFCFALLCIYTAVSLWCVIS